MPRKASAPSGSSDSNGKNRKAFEKIFPTPQDVEHCRLRVHRNIFRYVQDPDVREDIVSDAFVSALTHAEAFRGESNPITWMTTIATRLAISNSRKKVPMSLGELDDSIPAPEKHPVDALIAKEQLHTAQELAVRVLRVDPDLLDHFGNKVGAETLAQRNRITVNGEKTRLRRGRLLMAEKYPQYDR